MIKSSIWSDATDLLSADMRCARVSVVVQKYAIPFLVFYNSWKEFWQSNLFGTTSYKIGCEICGNCSENSKIIPFHLIWNIMGFFPPPKYIVFEIAIPKMDSLQPQNEPIMVGLTSTAAHMTISYQFVLNFYGKMYPYHEFLNTSVLFYR